MADEICFQPCLKNWEWEWIFGCAVKTISSPGVHSLWLKLFGKNMDRPLGDEFDEDASLTVNTSNSLQSSKYLKKNINYFRKKNLFMPKEEVQRSNI